MARRSVLFSPGDRPDMLRRAAETDADVAVFDLEDAVAPARKAEARAAVADVVTDPGFDPACEVWIRLSGTDDRAATDVDAVLAEDARVDAVVAPKVAGPADVRRLAATLADAGRGDPIVALVETAAGVLHAEDVAAVDGVDALAFGAEDLAADVGATRTDEGTEVLYAREHVVLAASAAGVDAVDTIYPDVEDTDGLRADAEFALELGYDGKMAIHPDQVGVINDAFTPAPDRVEWARRVLDARDEAGDDVGVFRVDDEMIDAPLIAQAERILDRAGDAPGTGE